jgi:hypothetical protein
MLFLFQIKEPNGKVNLFLKEGDAIEGKCLFMESLIKLQNLIQLNG